MKYPQKNTISLLLILLIASLCISSSIASGHNHTHDEEEYKCSCIVSPLDGACPSTEPSVKWNMKEKSMYEDAKGDRRPPTKTFEGDKGCCQFTVPEYVKNNSASKFKDNCDKHFVCPDFAQETQTNSEKAGAQYKTRAYSCSKFLDGEKLCACSTKEEIAQAKRRAENLLLVAMVVGALVLCCFCCTLCYCRRRLKRSGAASSKPASNPYLK